MKIYPNVAELNTIQNNIKCTENDCNVIFTSKANLIMHLQRHHKRQNLEKADNCIKQYYCPELKCIYNDKMYFKNLNSLKQHYLKVHAEKIYICTTCNKRFSTLAVQKKHTEFCGVKFTCLDCTNYYSSYEALTTHKRRKKHNIPNKSIFMKKSIRAIKKEVEQKHANNYHIIMPKYTNGIQTVKIVPLIVEINGHAVMDKEIQTDLDNVKAGNVKHCSTQHTQTCFRLELSKSAETQTTDKLLSKDVSHMKIFNKYRKKSMDMQTDILQNEILSKDQSSINSDSQTEMDGTTLYEKKSHSPIQFLDDNIMHSSAQTNLDLFLDELGNCNSQTQTDMVLTDTFLQSNAYMSHIETQTNEENDLELYTNMHTQTSAAIIPDLEFSNIQTQTTWPEYDSFVSTETQTLLTQDMLSYMDMDLNGRETNHMETQTEFQQMLEEINS